MATKAKTRARTTEKQVRASEAGRDLTPGEAEEYVAALNMHGLSTLATAVGQRLERERLGDGKGGIGPNGIGQPGDDDPLATWDYQREPHGNGHVQKDPKVRKMKDGSTKVYGYWYFQWIEDGRRKSEYIGSDENLSTWKRSHPGGK